MKANQHATLFFNVTHRQASTVTIVPRGTDNRRQDVFGFDFANMPKRIEHHTFFKRDLSAGLQVLHSATATAPWSMTEIRATWLHTHHAFVKHFSDAAHFKAGLIANALIGDTLTGERTFNEGDLAVVIGHAATFLVEAQHIHCELIGRFILSSCHRGSL